MKGSAIIMEHESIFINSPEMKKPWPLILGMLKLSVISSMVFKNTPRGEC